MYPFDVCLQFQAGLVPVPVSPHRAGKERKGEHKGAGHLIPVMTRVGLLPPQSHHPTTWPGCATREHSPGRVKGQGIVSLGLPDICLLGVGSLDGGAQAGHRVECQGQELFLPQLLLG